MSDLTNTSHGYGMSPVRERPGPGDRALTDTMLFYLNGASPWLRFVGVLGIIYSVVITASGLFFLLPAMDVLFGMLDFGFSHMLVGMGVWWGLFYAVAGLSVFLPSLFAYRFGGKIRAYSMTGNAGDLELAFKSNKSLWKFLGIVCVLGLVIVILTIVLGTLVVAVIGMEGFI